MIAASPGAGPFPVPGEGTDPAIDLLRYHLGMIHEHYSVYHGGGIVEQILTKTHIKDPGVRLDSRNWWRQLEEV